MGFNSAFKGLIWLRIGTGGGCCGYGNEPWDLKKYGELVAFKNDCVVCGQSVVFPLCVTCS